MRPVRATVWVGLMVVCLACRQPDAIVIDLLADPGSIEMTGEPAADVADSAGTQELSWDFADPSQTGWSIRRMQGRAQGGYVQRGGMSCLLIAADDPGADADLRTHVRVDGDTEYVLEASLWTDRLEPLDAQVFGTVYVGEFDYVRPGGDDGNDPTRWLTSGPRFVGSGGWQAYALRFRTEPTTRMLRLAASLGNWGRSRGELCLGPVRLRRIDAPTALATGSTAEQIRIVDARVGDTRRRAVVVTPASKLHWSLEVPPHAVLAFGVGVDGAGGGATFEIEADLPDAEVPDDEPVRLYRQPLFPGRGTWKDVVIPLDAFAGQRIRLTLRARPSPEDGSLPALGGVPVMSTMYWSEPRVVSGQRTIGQRRKRPDVFLITVDTLRPDHLGCYGYQRPTSPAIDALARDGTLFENAFTTVPRTVPAVASLLTGSYPADHGVHSMVDALCGEQRTLAEALRAAGYRTGAQVTLNLPGDKGLGQGFDSYDDRASDPVARGEDLGLRARHWLQQPSARPRFYWFHTWDPHFVYDAPAPWTRTFDPGFDPSVDGIFDLYERIRSGRRTWGQTFFQNDLAPRQVEHAVARYDGEIRYADQVVARFLETLVALDLYDDALIVFTSDHGESLGEHDYHFEHGEYLYDTTLRIPLIVKFPGRSGQGRRVAGPASILDVLPTILAAAGIDEATPPEGQDLARPLDTGRTLFAQSGASFFSENPRREVEGRAGFWTAIRQGSRKLIHIPRRDGATLELYDLAADPGETNDLFQPGDTEMETWLENLERWRAILAEESEKADSSTGPIDLEELDRLRTLGYIDSALRPDE